MYLLLQTIVALLFVGTITRTAAYPEPTPFVRRQLSNEDAFVGFYTVSNTWTSTTCASGSTFATNGAFAACCTTTDSTCAMATGCSKNIALFPDGGSGVCRDDQQCESLTIRFDTTGQAAKTMVQCMNTKDIFVFPNTLYRSTFTLTTPTQTVTATATIITTTQLDVSAETEVPGGAGPTRGLGMGPLVVAVVGVAVAAAMAL